MYKLNPHNNPNTDDITVLIFQMGNSSIERLSNLHKVTKIKNQDLIPDCLVLSKLITTSITMLFTKKKKKKKVEKVGNIHHGFLIHIHSPSHNNLNYSYRFLTNYC